MPINKEKLMISGLRRLLNGTARIYRRGAGKIAYYFLTTPRRLEDEPGTEAFLEEAERGTYTFDGHALATYHWPGPGPSVLLLHGWESSTVRWHELYPVLAKAGYDIHALDAPAHGRSGGKKWNVFMYCQALEAYLAQLPAVPEYWIGHSGGGMAAIYYCTDFGGSYRPRRIVSMAVPALLENFIDKFCALVGANDRVKYGIEHQFQRRHQRDFAYVDFTRFVQQLEVPGLIVHDEEDDVAPMDGVLQMHRNWSRSELVTTRGCGHSLVGRIVPAIVVEYLNYCREGAGNAPPAAVATAGNADDRR